MRQVAERPAPVQTADLETCMRDTLSPDGKPQGRRHPPRRSWVRHDDTRNSRPQFSRSALSGGGWQEVPGWSAFKLPLAACPLVITTLAGTADHW